MEDTGRVEEDKKREGYFNDGDPNGFQSAVMFSNIVFSIKIRHINRKGIGRTRWNGNYIIDKIDPNKFEKLGLLRNCGNMGHTKMVTPIQ